jgi:hypothetical protein
MLAWESNSIFLLQKCFSLLVGHRNSLYDITFPKKVDRFIISESSIKTIYISSKSPSADPQEKLPLLNDKIKEIRELKP